MADDGSVDVLELDSGSPDLSPRAQARRITASAKQHPIAHYCEVYGRPGKPLDRKTVERWIAKGREADNLPPLDSPEEMAGWWREVIGRKVPEVFELFESRKEKEAPPAVGVRASAVGEVASGDYSEMIESARSMASKAGLGFGAALERAQASERLAWAIWQESLSKPEQFSESAINKRKKAWEDALSAMRQAEVVAEKVMKRSDEWGTWGEFEREMHSCLVPLATGVRSLLTRVAVKVVLPPGLFDVLAPAFQSEVDRLFSELGEGGFVEALELTA